MFKNSFQKSKLINNNLPLFNILCLLCVIYIGIKISYWYFLFLILVVLISLKIKLNWKQVVLCVGIIAIYMLLLIFFDQFSLFGQMSRWFKSNFVRQKIFDYFDSVYNLETSSFIKLILFGEKSQGSYVIYKQTVDLGIVWLLSISGFHLSFLSRTFYKITKKVWKITKWINFTVVLFYSYLLKFSYASMRVALNIVFSLVYQKFDIKDYNKIGITGLSICLLNPCCFESYSFLLGFICVIGACFIKTLNIQNSLINNLLNSSFMFVLTIPFVIKISHKISIFTFVNSFIFTTLFGFIFLYFMLFSWIPYMWMIHSFFIKVIYTLIGNISFNNIFIYSKEWSPYIEFAYYCGIYSLNKLIYLIVFNNKI